ncbi:uncharacterized protein LOC133799616 [Humulus lupulus]|uniref:uncharacterized protein LOC133799616 n=1 Tax=Humulus lupulus TaxID=3486 RepID=UPI002B40C545|nr:uncharacterized protein LOC133799616 [Humulus lupulus]
MACNIGGDYIYIFSLDASECVTTSYYVARVSGIYGSDNKLLSMVCERVKLVDSVFVIGSIITRKMVSGCSSTSLVASPKKQSINEVKSLDIPSLRLILMENEHFTSPVSVAYRIQVLRNIRSLLCYEDLEASTASCSSHLLKLIDLAKSSGQLIHFLLQRRVQTNKENELWFDIDSQLVRFSMHEFVLISGFNCGKSNDPNLSSLRKSNRLKKEYFMDIEGHINLTDLETMFVDMSEENLVGELKKKKKYIKKNRDHLRLALLYCLEGVMLAHELPQPIGEENMGIVEDFDVFNKYPWGRLCYNLTLDGLKTNLKKKFVKYQNKVWIYEAIFLLGNLFANQKEGNVTPRCLHWEAKEPDYKKISQALKLAHGKIGVHNILHASELEKCQPYMKDFELLNDKVNDLIDTFVKKLKVCSPILSEYNKEEEKVDVPDDKKCALQLQMSIQIRIRAM